jgi:hypothetical protein
MDFILSLFCVKRNNKNESDLHESLIINDVDKINVSMDDPVIESVVEPVDEIVDESLDEPVDVSVDEPVVEHVDESVDESLDVSVDEPVVEHVDESVDVSVDEPVDEIESNDDEFICKYCCNTQGVNCCFICDSKNTCDLCYGQGGDFGEYEEWVCNACLPVCLRCDKQLYSMNDYCCGKGRSDIYEPGHAGLLFED